MWDDERTVSVWDLVTGTPRSKLLGRTTVRSLALSPAGDRLLIGADTLAVYELCGVELPRLLAELFTSHSVTALVVNPVMPDYALFGAAGGQVGYVRLPVDPASRHSRRLNLDAAR